MGATPEWLVRAAESSEEHHDRCRRALAAYFDEPTPGRLAFSGANFDLVDENPPDRVVADDLVAISLLSVDVPQHAALRLLGPDAARVTALLRRILVNVDLHDADVELVDHDSPAEALWTVLREHTSGRSRGEVDGLGEVTTSKLLARKRPRLLPVWDEVVRPAARATELLEPLDGRARPRAGRPPRRRGPSTSAPLGVAATSRQHPAHPRRAALDERHKALRAPMRRAVTRAGRPGRHATRPRAQQDRSTDQPSWLPPRRG